MKTESSEYEYILLEPLLRGHTDERPLPLEGHLTM